MIPTNIRATLEAALAAIKSDIALDVKNWGDKREAIERIDEAAAWLTAQPAQEQPLDCPDGEGWWAFEGFTNIGISQMPLKDVFSVHSHGDFMIAGSARGSYIVSEMHGKWYRLTMPWEVPAQEQPGTDAAGVQPDWSYSGGATVETHGGGLLAMRLDGPFEHGRPPDGLHDVALTFTLQRRPAPTPDALA